MGTSNFYNHENGIFIIEDVSLEEAYEDYKQHQIDFGEEIEPMEDVLDMLYDDISIRVDWAIEGFVEYTLKQLPYGMEANVKSMDDIEITNKQGKIIAVLTIQRGYYEHTQIIVETDPDEIFRDYMPDTKTELYEQYSPHHQRLLNFMAEVTTPLIRVGGFSDGTSVYTVA